LSKDREVSTQDLDGAVSVANALTSVLFMRRKRNKRKENSVSHKTMVKQL